MYSTSNFRVSWFRNRGVVSVFLVVFAWSFFPSSIIAQQQPSTTSAVAIDEIQTLLQRLGYDPGSIDGKIGQKTTAAIEAFQTKIGLTVDGEPSTELLGSLQKELANVIQQRAANGDVTLADVQFLLQQAGYDPGPVDGKMGTKTAEAITAFQTAMNLPVDEELSIELLQALHKEFVKVVGPTATLSVLDGTVLVNNQQAEIGAVLSVEDKITTQAGTTAELTLSDGSRLELEENSRLTLAELTHTAAGARISYLKLLEGRIRAFLSQEHQQEGSAFTIETPNAKIDATFSEPDIEVSYSAEKLETLGIAHTVKLMAKNLATNEKVLVPVGSTVIITSEATKVIAGIILSSESIEPEETPEPVATPEPIPTPEPTVPAVETASGMGKGKMLAIGVGGLAALGGVVALAGGGDSNGGTSSGGDGTLPVISVVNLTCLSRGSQIDTYTTVQLSQPSQWPITVTIDVANHDYSQLTPIIFPDSSNLHQIPPGQTTDTFGEGYQPWVALPITVRMEIFSASEDRPGGNRSITIAPPPGNMAECTANR
ncbi:MAG: hypothetical protein GY801_04215 [bacterium]|nr:hypothetical protein [bacterium]